MAKPFVIQNPYKNTPATGNRLISVSELEDAVKGVFKSPCRAISATNIAGTYSTEDMTLTVTEPGENWAVEKIQNRKEMTEQQVRIIEALINSLN